MNLDEYYEQVSHPQEATDIMQEEAVVPLGTALWP